MKAGGIAQPVTLIQTISTLGPGLKKAHEAVTILTNGGTAHVILNDSDERTIRFLEELGVTATVR